MKNIGDIGMMDYFLLLALLFTTVLIVWFGYRQVDAALRTGRIGRRGVYCERALQPIMFWRGILFWITICAVMIFINVVAALAVFRTAG